ncbi:permease-like cell division protein FtsX [Methylophilaceae bacterium]|nr:permease-like cell division protein FtsX [Methylophilaceae bacterium]|tara:strand:+ start:1606 stop:2517 length:912 start_codon:yes stop_codon:yes gene_type:complete
MFNYFHNHFQAFNRALVRIISNFGSSLMMFIVIGVTLFLPSSGLLIVENVSQISNNIAYDAELSLFLKKGIKQDQIDFIQSALNKTLIVKKTHYESKLIAWDKLQSKLNLNPLSTGISENPLPDAFFISLNTFNEKEINALIDNLKTIDGVENIFFDAGWVKKLRSILYLLKIGLAFLGAILIIVLIVVIGNTIRLQTLTHKDEIEVSKLIGATNSFIQRPFIYTGLIYGLGGGLITVFTLKLSIEIFNKAAINLEAMLGGTFILKNLMWQQNLSIILIAMIIGCLASFFAAHQSIKKFEIFK